MKKRFLNLLEPVSLVDAFFESMPDGFTPATFDVEGRSAPAFVTRLDLSTTAEDNAKRILQRLGRLVPRLKTLFIGTTVSEYALFPDRVSPEAFNKAAKARVGRLRASLLIFKDIPLGSPLLNEAENDYSKALIAALEKAGFIMLEGQALAYVPIDFATSDEFCKRFSKSRRKDFKRKLRSFSEVSVEAVPTGAPFFNDAAIGFLYGLFENVYNQSEVHFDKLTPGFFKRVLTDRANNGVVFLYRHDDEIIGFNLCFVCGDNLVDKYVGFSYPEAREHNLYFLSWFHNLDYCASKGLKNFVAGWTDPRIKAYLGAQFTHTTHAVYVRNPLLRAVLGRFKGYFESDKKALDGLDDKALESEGD